MNAPRSVVLLEGSDLAAVEKDQGGMIDDCEILARVGGENHQVCGCTHLDAGESQVRPRLPCSGGSPLFVEVVYAAVNGADL